MSYLIDVNVWVALTVKNHVHHEKALVWFNVAPVHSSAFRRITQMGLLRILTNPRVMGTAALTVMGAWKTYSALLADDRIFSRRNPMASRSAGGSFRPINRPRGASGPIFILRDSPQPLE